MTHTRFHPKAKTVVVFCMPLFFSTMFQAQKRCDACKRGGIDMPVSLAAGTVRTPEFTAKAKFYNIDIDARWLIPEEELRCRMGFVVSPSDNSCKQEPLLETTWKVFEGGQVVAEGSDKGRGNNFNGSSDSLTRIIGTFKAERRHKYVVEVTFIRDASFLNTTKPHLIVEEPDSF